MDELRITKLAWEDVLSIVAWIEGRGAPLAAERWFENLLRTFVTLRELSERCPLAPESGNVRGVEIRQLVQGEFRILHTRRGDRIFVLHVRRAARLSTSLDELNRRLVEPES